MIYFITNQLSFSPDFELCSLEFMLQYFKDKKDKNIACDTETEGFDPYSKNLLLLQLGDYENQFVIDCTTVDIVQLKSFFEDTTYTFLFHNAKFDLKFLYAKGIIPYKNVYCTFLAERVLSCGIDSHLKNLQACVYRYYKIRLSKEERGLIHKLGIYHSSIIQYAARDVQYLNGIREFQLRKAKELDVTSTISLENKFVPVLAYVEYSGIYLDQQGWIEKSKKDKERMIKLEKELNSLVEELGNSKYLSQPDLFNTTPSCIIQWSSSKQVIPLFKELGLNLTVIDKKKNTEKESIESKVIFPQKHLHPIIPKFIEYQKAAKLVSTYGMDFLKHINKQTNRIHTNFTQIINTGRLSSGKEDDKDPKPGEVNMQNIPANPERKFFVAEKGNKLAVADYTGQETFVLGYYAQDPNYLDYITNPEKDLHSFMARLIYDLEGTDLEIKKNHKDKRTSAKPGTFCIPYGGSGYTIAQNVGVTPEKGEYIYNEYMKYFSGLNKYFERVKEEAFKNGYVLINPKTGRKWFFIDREILQGLISRLESYSSGKKGTPFQGLSAGYWDTYKQEKQKESVKFKEMKTIQTKYFKIKGTMSRIALNSPIQGTSADISKYAGILMFNWIMENNYFNKVKICVPLHDEYCVEGPENIINEVASKLQECMEKAAKYFCPTVNIKAVPVISTSWEH